MNKFKASALHLLKVFLIVYVLVVIAAFLLQSQFLFHPTGQTFPPSYYKLEGFNETIIRTEDNVKLTAWFHHSPGNEKTILFFYGSSDSLANYIEFFKKLADADYNILAINYRGYGGSKGHPSEGGFYLDADAALKFLDRYSDMQNVIIVGRSRGSAVAVDLASKNDVGGLVLISAFTNINAAAQKVFWFLPVKLISRVEFDSLSKISSVKAPVLLIHGENDQSVPYSEAEELAAAVKTRHVLVKYPGAGHNDLDKTKIADDIMKFFGDGGDAYK